MKRENALLITIAAGAVCLAAGAGWRTGYLVPWLAELLLIAAFPVFVLFLGLWWNASEGEEDIPFLGY
ncbi:MAG: hypothetical protein QCH35_00635 [Methanomicrobiaceae archaeon]|nr:hypothetical protein [Methanomicrobiaceae archaeon]